LAEFLLEENKKINLTAIRDLDGIYQKHFLDSLTLNLAFTKIGLNLAQSGTRIADIGSGAGFPGLPLAIAFPKAQIMLVESIGKKCKFLENAVKFLNLKNVQVINARAENLSDLTDKIDVVVSRAVAFLSKLSNWCLPLVRKNGFFIAMKNTESAQIEIADEQTKKILKKNNSNITKQIKIEIPNLSPRELIVIQKE
jgi:16S rRNA (guanine527-N7)-methyltransferase